MNAEDAKKIRKRRLIKFIIIVLSVLAVLLVITLVLKRCMSDDKPYEPVYSYDLSDYDISIGYYKQEIDYDIFEDENFASYDRGIMFYRDAAIGEYYTDEDRAGANPVAEMFIDYFKAATNGDGKTLNSFFTEDYFNNYGKPIAEYPDRFPMQKIYRIEVIRTGDAVTETDENGEIKLTEYYKVSFLIKDNNGHFRPDLPEPDGSGSTIPLFYEVITQNGVSLINRIILPR